MRRTSPDEVIRNAGRRVAEIRAEKGWTQLGLAERLDVSLTYVQRIEAGRANLSLRSLTGIANVLQRPVASLLTPAATKTPPVGRPRRERR